MLKPRRRRTNERTDENKRGPKGKLKTDWARRSNLTVENNNYRISRKQLNYIYIALLILFPIFIYLFFQLAVSAKEFFRFFWHSVLLEPQSVSPQSTVHTPHNSNRQDQSTRTTSYDPHTAKPKLNTPDRQNSFLFFRSLLFFSLFFLFSRIS